MGLGHSSSLRIGGDSSIAAGSGRTSGASDHSAEVDLQDAPEEPPFPLNKGKGRIDKIKYPGGSEYLKSGRTKCSGVGPSKVGPCMGPLSPGVINLLLVFGSSPPMF